MIPNHPRLRTVGLAGELIADLALASVRGGRDKIAHAFRIPKGETLRPGADTPLWNALAAESAKYLVRRGDKANLARYLGLPRQRVYDFLNRRSTLPDAERALLLLHWLALRKTGVNPF